MSLQNEPATGDVVGRSSKDDKRGDTSSMTATVDAIAACCTGDTTSVSTVVTVVVAVVR